MAHKTGSVRHTHQYYKAVESGLWHCSGYDGCTHYMPRNMPPPVGRMSMCWSCFREFQLAPYNMEDHKPICDDCVERDTLIAALTAKKLAAAITNKPVTRVRSRLAQMTLGDEYAPTTESTLQSIEEDKPESEDV